MTIRPPVESRYFGKAHKRLEDPRFLLGKGRYIHTVNKPGTLYASFVRSTEAHAELVDVDVKAALAHEGVVAVVTGTDVRERTKPMRGDSTLQGWQGSDYWALAQSRVRFVGEPIACVVATDRYVAEDGAELVSVSYDRLTPITSVAESLAEGAEMLHDGWTSNCFIKRHLETEDFEAEMARSDHRLSMSYAMGRHTGMPLETRGCLAEWNDSTGELEIWTTTQIPYICRTGLADVLAIPENRIVVISPDIGGGFGVKFSLYPEEIVCALASMLVRAPIKWLEDRREHMVIGTHAREHYHNIEVGFNDAGEVGALRARIVVDNGAYSLWPETAAMEVGMALGILPGPYRIQNYKVDSWAVCTNKTPLGAYRGVSRPAACFSIERTMDAIAENLGLDRAEVRRRNLVTSAEFPYTSATGLTYDSGSLVESLDAALERIGYQDFRQEQLAARDEGRHLGVGVVVYTEQTAHTWEEFKRRGVPNTYGYESATLRMDPSATVTLYVSTHSHGQGHETTFAQIVADELGIDIADVRVRFGDTSKGVYGAGTFASRSAVLAGGACLRAAQVLREKLKRIAAHDLEASPEDIEIADGHAFVRGSPQSSRSLWDLARLTYHRQHLLPVGEEPVLESTMTYDAAPGTGTFANAAMAAVVEVDSHTGLVTIERLVAVEDCGRMINPLIVEGQVAGGVAQGIGSALLEQFLYDENGQPLVTTFMDYLLPGSTDVPNIEVHHLESPSTFTLQGIKGVGEGGAIGPGALIAAAVEDALRTISDARVDTLPLTPERILGWINGANTVSRSSTSERGGEGVTPTHDAAM